MMNDSNDAHHERERKRLELTWDQYWYRLAEERVGNDEEQIADVLAQLRAGGYENRIRADTIERLLLHPRIRKFLQRCPTLLKRSKRKV